MNARPVEDVLDRLSPRGHFPHDWGEVLERSGLQEADAVGPARRTRKWLLLAAVVAAIAVPMAAATVAVTNWSGWLSSSHDRFRPASEPMLKPSSPTSPASISASSRIRLFVRSPFFTRRKIARTFDLMQ